MTNGVYWLALKAAGHIDNNYLVIGPWRHSQANYDGSQLGPLKFNGDTATEWHLVMTATLLAMLPPLAVVLTMQRWFVRGLVDSEK